MNRPLRSWTVMALALLPAGLAPAVAAPPPGLSVSGQWMRALTPGLPAAGYFTLSNNLDRTAQLTGAASPACGSLTLHQTIRQHVMSAMSGLDPDNPPGRGSPMMSMQAVAAVTVPAHGAVRFSPGGYHLMCGQPTGAVRPGHGIPVTLSFDGGGSIDADFPVRGPRG